MATATTKKKTAKKTAADKKPEPRVPYMDTELGERNDEGKLVGMPVDFDGKKHLKPKRDDFADTADFYEYQATECDERIEYFTKQKAKWLENAESFRRFGDPEKRKMHKRAERLRAQLAQIEQELDEEGAEVVEE